jgi:hypothetical protein
MRRIVLQNKEQKGDYFVGIGIKKGYFYVLSEGGRTNSASPPLLPF